MANYDYGQVEERVQRRLDVERSNLPSQFLFVPQVSVTDASGSTDVLVSVTQHPNFELVNLVAISLSPLSSAGQWRSDGVNVTAASGGLFLPAGGGVIYLYTPNDIRFFRIQASAGGTILLTAAAYRRA